ncbi:gliding motility lipoprotein GldB [Flavobacterium sp.]
MKKYFYIVPILFLLFISCNQKSKIEKEVEEIPVQIKVVRFEKAFFECKPSELQNLKNEYPFFFPNGEDDSVWLEKMQNPLWRELYAEVEKKYSSFDKHTTDLEELFKHLKYYFPTIITPTVYTVIGEMDYNNKAIYANDKLIISLELYLGKEHKFYEFPEYLKQNFTERQMMPDVVSSFSMRTNPSSKDQSLLAEMIYYGKELYLKDILLPDYTDAEKIGYQPEQITWCKENESYMWRFFVDESLLYSSDSKLQNRFINLAPFSKFYLEIDNETPGRVGQWIGWQIVRSFMKSNEKVTIKELLAMDYKQIFDQSKYKPKK